MRAIGDRPEVKAVVWGSTRLLRVTFAKTVTVKTLDKTGLQIITELPQLDVPFVPIRETLVLLAASFSHDETTLKNAGAIVAPWRYPAIRAFVFYRLGTMQLQSSIAHADKSESELAKQDLAAASDSLQTAIRFLTAKENTFLERAVRNNYATVLILKGIASGDSEALLAARGQLLDAARLIDDNELEKYPALIDSIAVQRNNSDIIRKYFSTLNSR